MSRGGVGDVREPRDGWTVADLVVAARSGDRAAWAELMSRFGGMVQSVAWGFRLQEADVADIAQLTWLCGWKELDALRDPARFGGWIRTIAHRECLGLRETGRGERLDALLADHLQDPAPGPEAAVLGAETTRAVRAAVESLGGSRRTVVESLFYRQDHDYAGLSARTGIAVGSIGPTRTRALAALREWLVRRGYGPDRESRDPGPTHRTPTVRS